MSELGERLHHIEKSANLERTIHDSEIKLGLNSSYDRLREASLFIDKKFMDFAVITGTIEKPERLFGDEEWADFLDARIYAKEYGKKELTTDFIISLHKQLTKRSDKEKGGKIRDCSARATSFDKKGEPVSYTYEQIAVIKENPFLYFTPAYPKDGNTGYIGYIGFGERTEEMLTKKMGEVCEWFNEVKSSERYDPFIVAGQLQQKLIALHPFEDINGNVSRVLMNWSLENDGEAPCILSKPEEDLITDPFDWVAQVREGSGNYKKIQEKQLSLEKAEIHNDSALLGLSEERTFYDYIYKYVQDAGDVLGRDKNVHHTDVENYLDEFGEVMRSFNRQYRKTSDFSNSMSGQEGTVQQGGLISSEWRDYFASMRNNARQHADNLFTDFEVYRGGMIRGEVNESEILRLFTTPVGITTGYMGIGREGILATSLAEIPEKRFDESFDEYNVILAKDFMEESVLRGRSPYLGRDIPLPNIIAGHVYLDRNRYKSPFVSTSDDYSISKKWATNFGEDYARLSTYSFLISAYLPNQGVVKTSEDMIEGVYYNYNEEREFLVAGGIAPESIQKVEIYHRHKGAKPIFEAYRDGEDVVIQDGRGKYIVEKRYHYDDENKKFVLFNEVTSKKERDIGGRKRSST